MRINRTELVFILDRSGSMSGLESDTIGGYNALIKKQQAEKGSAVLTTVLFDDGYDVLHDRADIRSVQPMTDKQYFVRGTTALLDAVGKTISRIGSAIQNTPKDERPDKVLVAMTTDGLENASREYSYTKVKAMIERKKRECGWEFLFLGANIDAAAEAEKFGISQDRAANFHADSKGTQLNYAVMSKTISDVRRAQPISQDWKGEIDRDYRARK